MLSRIATSFSAFRYSNYRWYWVGMFFSFASHPMQQLAKGWLVYQMTSSPLALGGVNAAHAIPLFTLSLFGGAIADRMSKRKLIIGSELSQGVINLIVALLVFTGTVQLWHIFLSSFLTGVASAFRGPVRQAIVPELVDKKDVMNAIALNSVGNNLSQILAPAVGGVLIAVFGMSAGFFIISGLLFTSALTMTRVISPLIDSFGKEKDFRKDLVNGFKYLRSSSIILSLLTLTFVISFFAAPYQFMLPVFAKDIMRSGSKELGWMMSMIGVGAIVGALAIALLGDIKHKGYLLLGLAFLFGVSLVLFTFSTYLPLSLFLLVWVGMGNTGFSVMSNTLLLSMAEPQYRGRVMSLHVLAHSLRPLGALPIGAAAELMGAPMAVGAGGALVAVFIIIISFAQRKIRQL